MTAGRPRRAGTETPRRRASDAPARRPAAATGGEPAPSAREPEGPTWRIAGGERADPVESAALAPLRAFADDAAFRLGRLDPVAGEVLREGLLAAEAFTPTLARLKELGLDLRARTAVAWGKAAVPMALAWHAAGGRPGLLVAPAGTRVPPFLADWEARLGEHPLPGPGSRSAGARILETARSGADVVLLLSGGASSLAEAALVPGREHDALLRRLLALGLPIARLNAARGLLSALKAGGVARAAEEAGGSVEVLYASDVPRDEAAVVGSGPAARADLRLLRREVGRLPEPLSARILGLARSKEEPSRSAPHHCVRRREDPARAAARKAEALGQEAVLSPAFDGPAPDEAARLAAALIALPEEAVLVSWGEPLVALPPRPGKGGRTSHLLTLLALALAKDRPCAAAVAATDGDDAGRMGGACARLDGSLPVAKLRTAVKGASTGTLLAALGEGHAGLVPPRPTGANCADLLVARPRDAGGLTTMYS